MSLPNAYLQSLIDICNDPTTNNTNIDRKLGGQFGFFKTIIAALIAGGAGGTQDVEIVGGSAKVPVVIASTDGSQSPITSGKQSIGFAFSSDFEGSVQGVDIDPTKTPPFSMTAQKPDTLGAVAFTVTAGTLTVVVIP